MEGRSFVVESSYDGYSVLDDGLEPEPGMVGVDIAERCELKRGNDGKSSKS